MPQIQLRSAKSLPAHMPNRSPSRLMALPACLAPLPAIKSIPCEKWGLVILRARNFSTLAVSKIRARSLIRSRKT
jgi:hypothetical protein